MPSRFQTWLRNRLSVLGKSTYFGLRDKPQSYANDFFATPTLRRLEPRRVLTVSATSVGGLLTVDFTGDPAENVQITNIGDADGDLIDDFEVADAGGVVFTSMSGTEGAITDILINDDDGADTDMVELVGAFQLSGDIEINDVETVVGTGDLSIAGSTTIHGAVDVDLSNVANDFQGAVNVAADNDVTIVDSNEIDLGNMSIVGNLEVETVAGDITDSGAIEVAGMAQFTSSDGNIDLGDLDVVGSIGLSATGNATIVNAVATDLKASDVGGDLDVTSTTGDLTDSGAIEVEGMAQFTSSAGSIDLGDLDVVGSIGLSATGDATIVNAVATDLKASDVGGNLDVTSTTGDLTDSGSIDVEGMAQFTSSDGNIDLGDLDVVGSIGLSAAGNATIVNAVATDLKASDVGGDLDVTSTTGDLTDSGAIEVEGMAQFTSLAGSIDLGDLEVAGSIGLSATGDATIVNAVATDLKASDVGGDLDVTSADGDITDSGAIDVAGMAQFTSSDGSIDLGDLDVIGSIGLSATGDATIVNAVATDLKASDVGGDLDVTSTTGDLTDSGLIDVAGMAQFTSEAGSIDLGDLDVIGSIGLSATGDATIVNAVATDLKASNVGGDLDVTSTTGDLTESGLVEVAGMAQFTSSAGSVELSDLDVVGSIGLSATGNATIVNAVATDLKASDVGGDLDVTSTDGDITDSGAIDVAGMAQFTSEAGSIDLGDLDVIGSIGLSATGDATIVNAVATDLKASDVGGDLDVTSTTGDLTDSGSIEVAGMAQFTSSAGNIDLGDLDVVGSIGLSATGNATIVNVDALDLKASNVGGDLDVTSSDGGITDSGLIDVEGMAQFTSSAGSIELSDLDVVGSIGLTTTGDATIVNAVATDLKASDVGGDLDVTSTTGDLTNSGAIDVDGMAQFTSLAGSIDLGTPVLGAPVELDVAGSIGLSATGNASIVNAVATDLKASDVDGDLSVTSNTGGITQSGSIEVLGATDFEGDHVTLTDVTNDFVGKVTIVSTGDVSIADANTISLDVTASSLTVEAPGNIDVCNVVVSGKVDLTTLADVDIVTAGDIVIAVSAANLNVIAGGSIDLCGPTLTEDMTLATGGDLTQSGVVNVDGDTSITLTGPGGDVYLHGDGPMASGPSEFANSMDGLVTINGNDAASEVEIRNDSATATFPVFVGTGLEHLILTHSNADMEIVTPVFLNVEEDVTLTSAGDVTDLGSTLNVTGNVSINADGSIVLSEAAEQLTVGGKATFLSSTENLISVGTGTAAALGTVNFDGGDVTIVESDTIQLCGTNSAVNLALTSGGDILDEADAELIVSQSAVLDASGAIVLGDTGTDRVEFGHNIGSDSLSSNHYLTLNASSANLTVDSSVNLRSTGVGFDVGALDIEADGDIIQVDGSSGGEILVVESADFAAGSVILTDTDFGSVAAVLTGSSNVQSLSSSPDTDVELPLDIPNQSNTGIGGSNDLTPVSAPGGSVAGSNLYGQVIGDAYGFVISNHGDLDVGEIVSPNGSAYIETLADGDLTFEGNVTVAGSNHAVTAVAGGILEIDTSAYGGAGALLTSQTGAVANVGAYQTFSSIVFPPRFVVGTGPLLQVTQPNNMSAADGSNTASVASLTPAGWLVEFELEIGSDEREQNFIIATAFLEDLEIMYDADGNVIKDANDNIVLEPVSVYSVTHLAFSTYDSAVDGGTGYTTVGDFEIVDQDPSGTVDVVVDFEHIVPYSILNSELEALLPDAPTFFRVFNDPLINLYQGVNVSQTETVDRLDADANPNFLDLNESLIDIPDAQIEDPNHAQAIYGGYTFETFIPTAAPHFEPAARDPQPELDLPTPIAKPGVEIQNIPTIEFDDVRPFVIQSVEKVQYGPVDQPGGEFTDDPETYEGSASEDVVQKVRDKIDSDDNYEPGNYEIQVLYTDGSFDEFQHVKEFESEDQEQEVSAEDTGIVSTQGDENVGPATRVAWERWAAPEPVTPEPGAMNPSGPHRSAASPPLATAFMAAAVVAQRSTGINSNKRRSVDESLASRNWTRFARLQRRMSSHLFNESSEQG